jgi:hypothetical protein
MCINIPPGECRGLHRATSKLNWGFAKQRCEGRALSLEIEKRYTCAGRGQR